MDLSGDVNDGASRIEESLFDWPTLAREEIFMSPLELFLFLLFVLSACGCLLRFLNFHPGAILEEAVHSEPGAPKLSPSQSLRSVTYNVQYLAGTQYSFFYDGGPDTVATACDVNISMKELAEFLIETDADFVFLQEIDVGAKRSGYVDQIVGLRAQLGARYPAFVSTYYWRSRFVPHPKVWGSVGMKMLILSKYKLGKAYRHRLAQTPGNPIDRDFNIKRAFLEVVVPLCGGMNLTLINTHLEAFTEGTQVLEIQIEQIRQHLKKLDAKRLPWILAGDFNALPPGQFELLRASDRGDHTDRAELRKLFDEYQGVPTPADATGAASDHFFTFTVRGKNSRRPVRTLDYLFVSSSLRISNYHVEGKAVLDLSDHLPVIAEIKQMDAPDPVEDLSLAVGRP
jgi:endonuclease/exonuclease/phosphatase family metal-dependent hydrolase